MAASVSSGSSMSSTPDSTVSLGVYEEVATHVDEWFPEMFFADDVKRGFKDFKIRPSNLHVTARISLHHLMGNGEHVATCVEHTYPCGSKNSPISADRFSSGMASFLKKKFKKLGEEIIAHYSEEIKMGTLVYPYSVSWEIIFTTKEGKLLFTMKRSQDIDLKNDPSSPYDEYPEALTI